MILSLQKRRLIRRRPREGGEEPALRSTTVSPQHHSTPALLLVADGNVKPSTGTSNVFVSLLDARSLSEPIAVALRGVEHSMLSEHCRRCFCCVIFERPLLFCRTCSNKDNAFQASLFVSIHCQELALMTLSYVFL